MDTEFECASCGEQFSKAAFAVVMYSPDAFAKIFIFCSRECYQTPFHKALSGLTPEQRLSLKNITIWIWGDEGHIGITVPDAQYLFMAFEEGKSLYEKQLEKETGGWEMLKFEGEKNNPEYDNIARRLKRILLSTRPEPYYHQNFKALYFLLRGSISEGPEKLE